MGRLNYLWKKLTPTKSLEQSSGTLETSFYESVYRIAYLAGLSSSDYGILYIIYSTSVKIMVALFVIGELWYASTEPLSLDEIAACINAIVIHLITLYKLKNLMDHKDVYKRLATSMESPFFDVSTKRRQEIVNFWVQRHERYLKLLLALGNSALTAWYMYPLLDELEYNLMVGVSLPFKYNTPFRYVITYILVGIAFNYTSHFCMVTDLIMQSHLIPLICQYSVLADCFTNLVSDCEVGFEGIAREHLVNNKKFVKLYLRKLGNLVEQHKFILNHSIELRTILSVPMLGQLAASGILICFVGYQATTTISVNITKCLMSLFYLGYNMFTLYIICRWCEEITIQSQNIGEAIYCSGWEQGMSKIRGVRTTILLVMLRSSKPLIFIYQCR
ncbi:uncharacterized protein LOC115446897 [Manduca sexta]|uniref:uncharacterized protein LOC115446897 n=1 Tax=Manduca sexta TaxID=7130 RepID=UPI00188DCC02|nr:uncharacterized protein LOC115446897 [Manduca sexta]